MGNSQQGFKSVFINWLARGLAFIVVSFIAFFVVVALGGKVTSLNLGPVQVALAPDVPQTANNSVASLQADNTQVSAIQPIAVANTSTACPYDAFGFWLNLPDQWFYEPGFSGAAIAYSYDGFAVWEPNYYGWGQGNALVFPADYEVNQWMPLYDTNFEICVDGSGEVYARYYA